VLCAVRTLIIFDQCIKYDPLCYAPPRILSRHLSVIQILSSASTTRPRYRPPVKICCLYNIATIIQQTNNKTISLFSHSKHKLLAVVHCIPNYHTRTHSTFLRLQKQGKYVCFLMLTDFRKSSTFVERSSGLTGLFLCDE